ncbi:response regulator [Pararhizobium haloflavum]|uniref:response regulator n=1 Tax=Pararhizobium haloflavum TaxID=2037914 RepID=UPI000C19C5CE|nr:response regulator [Pararhizobium haloflavum]
MQKNEALRGLRILLVEDDVLIAMDIEDLLLDQGCAVVGPFARVDDASRAAAAHELDGAILDLNLQGALSFPVMDVLKEREIPFIVCSGYVELPQLREKLMDVPKLGKPSDHRMLVETMAFHFAAQRTTTSNSTPDQIGFA